MQCDDQMHRRRYLALNLILNANCRIKRWFDKNLFFTVTAAALLFNILPYAIVGNEQVMFEVGSGFAQVFIHLIINPFLHTSAGQLINDCLCFALVGIYLERKKGSFKFALIFSERVVFLVNRGKRRDAFSRMGGLFGS